MADPIDDFVDAVHAEAVLLALVGAKFSVGLLETEALDDYPRVTWVSDSGTIEPVDDIGARLNSGTRTRQVRTDAANVEVHIWGEDREATRDIMHAVIVATWQEGHGSADFGNYTWTTENAPRSEFATRGAKLILTGAIRLPVQEPTKTLTTVSDQDHTVDFTDPGPA